MKRLIGVLLCLCCAGVTYADGHLPGEGSLVLHYGAVEIEDNGPLDLNPTPDFVYYVDFFSGGYAFAWRTPGDCYVGADSFGPVVPQTTIGIHVEGVHADTGIATVGAAVNAATILGTIEVIDSGEQSVIDVLDLTGTESVNNSHPVATGPLTVSIWYSWSGGYAAAYGAGTYIP